MEIFQSKKLIEGFSTCFRQHKATHTHCKFLHGYAISFNVTFEGPLDQYNWVMDYGFLKRSKTQMKTPTGLLYSPEKWFQHIFDHTVIIAADDPELEHFELLATLDIIHLRVLPKVGTEMFAKFVYEELNKFLYVETTDRVRVVQVECFEHAKNSAIYKRA